MNRSFLELPALKVSLSLCCVWVCVPACSASPSASEPPATPVAVESAAPAAPPTATASVPAPVTQATAETPPSSAPQDSVKEPRPEPTNRAGVPNWTFNGSAESRGQMVLRCENAFPPDDHSGKCMCEGYELNVCVDGIRHLTIDRKQCGFICRPTSQSAKKIALRCPDGTSADASAKGCACSGRKPFDPCAGGIASAKVTAGECVVTCKTDQ
jgi:hypothetical protein